MTDERAAGYAQEIRAWLLGRFSKVQATEDVPFSPLPDPIAHRPVLAWWILEGKEYVGLDRPLSRSWDEIDRMARALLATHNPTWREAGAPEGETDWLASSFSSLTTGQRRFVSRSSQVGLGSAEKSALLGWLEWLRALWAEYRSELSLDDLRSDPPWAPRPDLLDSLDSACLRRWAHIARRSRWPLLRSIAAESLRVVFEPQELARLPLPTKRSDLFELVCMVRVLSCLVGRPRYVHWLNPDLDGNSVLVPGARYDTQRVLDKEAVLSTAEFDDSLREAFRRQSLWAPQRVDGWLEFSQPRNGLRGVLLEAKSGEQSPDAAIYQLRCYRAALHAESDEPVLLAAVSEKPVSDEEGLRRALAELRSHPRPFLQDFWVFCSADDLPEVMEAAGLSQGASRDRDRAITDPVPAPAHHP